VNEAGIVFLALFFCLLFSIESFPRKLIVSELLGQPINNLKTIILVAGTEFRSDDEFGFVLAVYPMRASMTNSTTTDVINKLDISITDY